MMRSVSTFARPNGMTGPTMRSRATGSGGPAAADELGGERGDVAALVARALELVGAWPARSVGRGEGAGAIGRAAADLLHLGVAGPGIRQADDDHAVMEEGEVHRDERRLLAAMLGGGRGEGAA